VNFFKSIRFDKIIADNLREVFGMQCILWNQCVCQFSVPCTATFFSTSQPNFARGILIPKRRSWGKRRGASRIEGEVRAEQLVIT